jgi:hypothetical protein
MTRGMTATTTADETLEVVVLYGGGGFAHGGGGFIDGGGGGFAHGGGGFTDGAGGFSDSDCISCGYVNGWFGEIKDPITDTCHGDFS